MNVYVVVEGRVVEKAVYTIWIPEVNKSLSPATYIDEVTRNNFWIVSGNGYPAYFDVVLAGLEDVSSGNVFDRLVICVDSEDMTLQDKRDEVLGFIEANGYANADCRVVVQHFCFETWALGNRVIGSRNPKNESLRKYRQLYNVITHDPEGLPSLPDENLNRSQFAEKYLRLTLNDKNKRLSYSKTKPGVVAHPKFYHQVCKRATQTNHVQSFRAFMDAFV